jgi:hypothetical protein
LNGGKKAQSVGSTLTSLLDLDDPLLLSPRSPCNSSQSPAQAPSHSLNSAATPAPDDKAADREENNALAPTPAMADKEKKILAPAPATAKVKAVSAAAGDGE